MFSQLVGNYKGAAVRGGARGFSCGFAGLGDDYALGPYQLPNGSVVQIPLIWAAMSTASKLAWILASNLSAQDSIVLETESGIDSGSNPVPVNTVGGSARPTVDYVRAGDVVRVTIPVPSSIYLSQGDVLSQISNGVRGFNLNYINGTTPGFFGGGFAIDVQAISDFAHLADVASIVQTAAQAVGVAPSGPVTASFVSKVETTGGQILTPPIPTPRPAATNPASSSNPLSALGLGTLSSTNLLLIGGAGILLIVVLAKK